MVCNHHGVCVCVRVVLAAPLHVACMRHPKHSSTRLSPDSPDAARLLITIGHANVNAVNANGDNALSFAIAAGLNNIVEYLLSIPGVFLGSTRPGKPTPAKLATDVGNRDAAVMLLNTQVRDRYCTAVFA